MTPETYQRLMNEWREDLPAVIEGVWVAPLPNPDLVIDDEGEFYQLSNFTRAKMQGRIAQCLEAAGAYFSVDMMDILSPRRNKEFVHARFYGCWLSRHCTPYTYPQIARHVGNRDHTSIMSAVTRFDQMRLADDELKRISDETALSLRQKFATT